MSDNEDQNQVEAQPEVGQQEVDPFTKIPFNPHKGLELFAPIRPSLLKGIGAAVRDEQAGDERVR